MPLHAITATYGEQGLRARLAIEIARFDDAGSQRLVRDALQLAAQLHAADQRQREPYLNHLLRVALRIICHYRVRDTDIVCAALLHDTVEDHADDLAGNGRPGAFAVLGGSFGPEVASLVEAVTNPVYEPGRGKDEQYRAHVAISLAAMLQARVIKIADFTDNGLGVIHTTGPKAVRLAGKYAPLVPVLADLIARPRHAAVADGQGPHPRPTAHRSGAIRGTRPAGGGQLTVTRIVAIGPLAGYANGGSERGGTVRSG